MKEVIILTGAGQIGMAVARRIGYGKKIIIGDKNIENAQNICNTMNMAGLMPRLSRRILPQEPQYVNL